MHNFEYVQKEEWKPIKENILKIIARLQNEVGCYFTFKYHFVGSSKRNMITRDKNSNTGFDFDVNIEINDSSEGYSAKEIRDILRNGLDRATHNHGSSSILYDYTEDSTRVLTIKVRDIANSRIKHSCDFCITHECLDGRQQYIQYNKKQNIYSWEYQPKGYYNLTDKVKWIKKHKLWQEVRDDYIYRKNTNTDDNKKSRSLFAETIHYICQQNGYY